jgi:hypothetical protein
VKVDRAIGDVRDAEQSLAQHLVRFAERHAAEHDLYHTGHTLARQCETQLAQLAPFAEKYGAAPPDTDVASSPRMVEQLRRVGSDLLGRSEASGMLLIEDLRHLYLAIQDAELAWVILGQVAQAVRDGQLHDMVMQCHEAAEMRGKWLRTRVKESAPQVFST